MNYRKLTDEECGNFRTLPMSFDGMVRTIHRSGFDRGTKAMPDHDIDTLRDVQLFLNELPLDLGKGSLNGALAQLKHRIEGLLSTEQRVDSPALINEREHSDVVDLSNACAWQGIATYESMDECALRFDDLSRALVRSVLDQKAMQQEKERNGNAR